MIRIEDLAGKGRVAPQHIFIPTRRALPLARLHRHLGDAIAARRFAEAGLPLATKALKPRAKLEPRLAARSTTAAPPRAARRPAPGSPQ